MGNAKQGKLLLIISAVLYIIPQIFLTVFFFKLAYVIQIGVCALIFYAIFNGSHLAIKFSKVMWIIGLVCYTILVLASGNPGLLLLISMVPIMFGLPFFFLLFFSKSFNEYIIEVNAKKEIPKAEIPKDETEDTI